MRARKLYKHYLRNPARGTFYVDVNGVLQTSGTPTCLRHAPVGWFDTEIEFSRSDHYLGITRGFSTPLKFVGDGAAIIRTLFYQYRGIEELVELVVLKWDPATDVYLPFYKGLLDLRTMEDLVAEGVSVNTMESGAVQLLKTYENIIFEFPCDGSLNVSMPDGSTIQNVKVRLDGMLVQDTFHYVIPAFTASFPGDAVLPCSFVSNDGDNFGIVKGNPSYEQPTDPSYFQGPNYLMNSANPVTMRITGKITVASDSNEPNTVFRLYARSSQSLPVGTDGINHAVGLVGYGNSNTNPATQTWYPSNEPVVNGTASFNFDASFSVAANENPFILFFNQSSAHPVKIMGGEFTVTFNSAPQVADIWCIRAYDLWRLIVYNICQLSSSTLQQFNIGADSDLLQQYPGIFITSGDAIRAAGDPNYLKFYNRTQTNPANPTFQFFNFYNSIGPVIKMSLSDFFDGLNPPLSASLGNQILSGAAGESLFFEQKKKVFDPSVVTMTLPQVTEVKMTVAEDFFFNVLKVGQPNQQYDEKAGKYEWNTTAQLASPVKTLQKTLELVSKIRWDAYGIQYTLANLTTDAKSSTYNGSDNNVFGISADTTQSMNDGSVASFTPIPIGTGDALNGNQKPLRGVNEQPVTLPTIRGAYLRPDTSPSIFIFSQHTTIPGTATYTYSGIINGLPGDSVTLNFYYNGAVVATRTYSLVTGSTPFSDAVVLSEAFAEGDCLYVKAVTSATCDTFINTLSLLVGSSGSPFYTISAISTQEVQPGNPGQLLIMDGAPAGVTFGIGGVFYFGMATGFAVLVFNEALTRPNFTVNFQAYGQQSGSSDQSFLIKLYLNGVVVGSQTFIGVTFGVFTSWQTSPANFPSITRDMEFGDMLWVTISPTPALTVEVGSTIATIGGIATQVSQTSALTLVSNQIQVYPLLRKQYDSISGIPSLLGNLPSGVPITTGPGAPFNIEPFFTPRRMLMRNASFLASTLYNLVPDKLSFLTLDRNQYLSTASEGETITENSDLAVHTLGDPLFIPLFLEFKTAIKMNISQMQSYVANGHIAIAYLNKTFFGFPWKISQKPSIDDSQTWKVLLSPRTNLADLVDLNYDGLGPTLAALMPNKISFSKVQPFQFVPYGQTRPAKYHFSHIDDDLFINQVNFWVFKRDYYQKMMVTDSFPLQCLTNGLTVVPLDIYSIAPGNSPMAPAITTKVASVNMLPVSGSPLQPPYLQLEATISFSGLGLPNGFYTVIPRGSMASVAMCERIQVVSDFPVNQPTLLFEFGSSVNKQSTVFSISAGGGPFTSAFRVEGWISEFEPDEHFTVFEDQPADIELLNAIPYEKYVLNIGCADGVPPWVIRKVARIMTLDTVTIDGKPYTRDGDVKWQKKTSDKWPKGYWTLAIRPSFNDDAVTFGDDGSLQTNTIVTASIDLSAFGNNPTAGPQITQVTES